MLLKKRVQEALLDFPLRLKSAREARGFTRKSFATECGVHLPTYLNHEAGRHEVRISQAMIYSGVLGVSLSWLLWGRGHPLEHLDTASLSSAKSKSFLAYINFLTTKKEAEEEVGKN